jgi:glycosyltransferase involved in cell wall biosynthesis
LKVSVITPTYNSSKYITDTLKSVLNQTYKDFEIIIVDDGSTDETLSILNSFASKDQRISIYTEKHTGRPSIIRNIGLSYAKSDYISFLDSDDIYHKDKIRRELEVFEKFPEIDLVFADLRLFNSHLIENNKESHLLRSNFIKRANNFMTYNGDNIFLCHDNFYKFMSLNFCAVSIQTAMFRKQLLDEENSWFREDMLIGEDTDFWFRLAKKRRLAFINEVLSYYRQRDNSLTSNTEKYLAGHIFTLNENLKFGMDVFSEKEILKYKEKIAKEYFNLGYLYFTKIQMQKARTSYKQSLTLDFRAKTLIALIKTMIPNWMIRKYRKYGSLLF